MVKLMNTLRLKLQNHGQNQSLERLRKMRNTINTALGLKKLKQMLQQAIEKWKKIWSI